MNEHQYEKQLNIQTEGFQNGFPKSLQYHRYEPTPYKALVQLFEVYEPQPNACCIDVGCGKGRVPIYIYDRFHIPVKGIEMDPKFYAAAEHNLERYKESIKKKIYPLRFIMMLQKSIRLLVRIIHSSFLILFPFIFSVK